MFQPSNAAVLASVSASPGAIGYAGLGYVAPSRVKAVAVDRSPSGPFVHPSPEAVMAGLYVLARPLFIITDGFPQGMVREFLLFVLSDEGQRLVEEMGFVPVRPLCGG